MKKKTLLFLETLTSLSNTIPIIHNHNHARKEHIKRQAQTSNFRQSDPKSYKPKTYISFSTLSILYSFHSLLFPFLQSLLQSLYTLQPYYCTAMTNQAKKQRAISSFFAPTKKAPLPLPVPESSESAKRKLEAFLLTNGDEEKEEKAKKPRVSSAKGGRISTEKSLKSALCHLGKSKLTPLEKQVVQLKTVHHDKILAIQVGYKFKFFASDAVVASQLLNIMLIPGNIKLDDTTHDKLAYCSIPDNRLHIHLQRLLNHGLKVGVVKQTETAAIKSVEGSSKSGLFERRVTGVYTKATYMGDELLTGDPTINRSANVEDNTDTNTYILCIDELQHPQKTCIVAVQPLTGDIVYDEFGDNTTRDELDTRLSYLKPSEVVFAGETASETAKLLRLNNPAVTITEKPLKNETQVQADLVDFFAAVDEDGRSQHLSEHYILYYSVGIQRCISELVEYLSEFSLSNIFTIPSNFSSLTDSRKCMLLPGNTLKALDVFEVQDNPSSKTGTLLWLLDHTHTKKGSRLLKKWISRPLTTRSEIEERLAAVAELREGAFVHVVDALRGAVVKLGKTGTDLDRLLIKVHYSATYLSGKISRKEVYLMLKNLLDILDVSRKFGERGIADFRSACQSLLVEKLLVDLHELSQQTVVEDLLRLVDASAAWNDSNLNEQKIQFFDLRNGRFGALAAELQKIADMEADLDAELASIRSLLKRPQLSYVTNLKETHLVEVRNGKAVDSLPPDWVKISGTKTVSRFRTPAVSVLHKKLQYHNDMVLKVADQCFNEFLAEVDSHYIYFHQIVSKLALFDCLLSLARAAESTSAQTYVKPVLVDTQMLKVKLASHPILANLSSTQGAYVPNDIDISYDENRVLIITGPNMGGKSSYVKQIALLVIMAQIGCLLPCSEATMGIFDSIFMRMGASDNILRGKSTFMVEMLESANIVHNYTSRSLVILDEIGRGTGTSDGISLAYAILRYIIEDVKRPLTLFITHYPSLHVLEQEFAGVKNFHMAFLEKTDAEGKQNDWPEVIFLYKLVLGVVSNLYGLNVAKLAGIPQNIIENAFGVSEAMKALVEKAQIVRLLGQLTPQNAVSKLAEICDT